MSKCEKCGKDHCTCDKEPNNDFVEVVVLLLSIVGLSLIAWYCK